MHEEIVFLQKSLTEVYVNVILNVDIFKLNICLYFKFLLDLVMDMKMESMMILKDETAILAEDGKNCQANADVFQEYMGLTKYFDLLFSSTKGRKMNTKVGLHHLPTHHHKLLGHFQMTYEIEISDLT